MKKTTVLLSLLLFSILLVLNSCVPEISVGSIQGIVTNAKDNEPIQGVNISLSPTGLSAVTGSDGRYEFNNLQEGNYTVQGVKKGYESNTKNITVVSGNVSSGDMTLNPELASFRLNVEYLDFGTNFSSLNFKIINTSTSLPVSWSITESMAWLEATPSSGNLNAGQEVVVMVTIDRDQIEQNTTANLTVAGAEQTVVLPVNVSVSGSNGPKLQLSETSLDFGTSATSLAFYVMNTGPVGTSLNWTCSNVNVDWLMLSPTSGNTDGGSSTPVMATIDRSKIDGMVSTSVTVSGAGNTETLTISASTEGTGAAILQLSEGSIDFGETAVTKTFFVKNVGSAGTVLDWSITKLNVNWLTLTPMTGSTNAGSGTQVTAVIDRNKINGMVSTTITVNGSNNSANLSISAANFHPNLEVPVTAVDFGKIDTQKAIQIKNTGDEGSVLAWSIAAPTVDWLTVSPMSGNINANQTKNVNLNIDRTKITGDVSTTITVTAGNQSATVSITASEAIATMTVPLTAIDFGKISTQQTLQIQNTGDEGSVLEWSISAPSVNWLTVSPMSGNINANQTKNVNLIIDRTKFDGDVSTSIRVTGGGQTVTVNLTASTAEAAMSVPVTTVDFGKSSSQETFQIRNTGETGSLVNWSIATPSVDWLTVTPMAGSTSNTSPSTVTLIVDRNAFVGEETTSIVITGAGSTATVSIMVDNSVIVTEGLMAYYTFDEGAITDWDNNYNPGMSFGALTSTDTPNDEGLSLQFDGVTSYISIPDNIIPGGVPYSFNIWIKTNKNTVTFFGTDVNYYHVGILGNGSLAIYTGSYSTSSCYWATANPITAFLNNQWHMLTFTYNGTTCVWYIDGILFETVQKNAMFWTSTGINNTYFGKHGAAYGNCGNLMPFNGKMDNIRTYNRALTQDEVRALFNAKQ